MNLKMFIKLPLFVLVFVTVIMGGSEYNRTEAFSDQVIQRGATGNDVIELQSRLQYNGYYTATIDGVYGWSTYWAVRNFQDAFGLESVDGLVGQNTKDMLMKVTEYNRDFVLENLKNGKVFTHYGGVDWSIQSGPSEQAIQKAKESAEARRLETEKKYKVQQQPAPQGGGAEQGGKQPAPQGGGAEQGGKQPAPQGGGADQGGQAPAPQNEQGEQQAKPEPEQEEPEAQPQPEPEQEEPEAQQEETGGEPTAVNMPGGYSENDIQIMANAVYGEARGEPYIGQVAVAAVILNRLNSPTFPNTISGVIFEPLAFTAVADGQIWLTPNEQAKKAVLDAINGTDPTGNATYYFNPDTATSKWIWGRPQIKRIGKHIFCK